MRQQTSTTTRRAPAAPARPAPPTRPMLAVALTGVALGVVLLGEALARAAGTRAVGPATLFGVGLLLAALVVVAGGLLLARAVRRRLAAWTDSTHGVAWNALTPAAFEREVAQLFARAGYQVEHVGAAGDGGVDVRVQAPGRAGAGIVQCKRYAVGRAVGPSIVRELIGARAHERATTAWLATTGRPTPGARALAAAERIVILDVRALAAWDARLR